MQTRRCLWTTFALLTVAACARGADPTDLGGASDPNAPPLPLGPSSSDAAAETPDGGTATCDDPPCAPACAPGLAPCGGGCCGKVDGVSAGEGHTCARTSQGAVKCWGDDTYGQLVPVDVLGL